MKFDKMKFSFKKKSENAEEIENIEEISDFESMVNDIFEEEIAEAKIKKTSKEIENTMYTMWTVAMIICLVVSVVAVLLSTFMSATNVDGVVTPTETPVVEDTLYSEEDIVAPDVVDTSITNYELQETAAGGTEYIDSLTFLGDSTTYGLVEYEMLSDGLSTTQVLTPASGTLSLFNQSTATVVYPETGAEISIYDAVKAKKPEYLVITLGANGVSTMGEDYFKSEYTSLVTSVQEASPNTKIIINSIYPVESDYQYINEISNEKIDAANDWLRDVAKDCGARYLDSASVLKQDDGSLNPNYGNGDGIHLNSTGFQKVLDYMETHVYA